MSSVVIVVVIVLRVLSNVTKVCELTEKKIHFDFFNFNAEKKNSLDGFILDFSLQI